MDSELAPSGVAPIFHVPAPVSGSPATFPAGDQTVWADASGFFSAVCDELIVGELIHGENFSLFEAMSALEIMDPKMDAGMTTNGFKTAEEAIENGAAPIALGVPQIIDIMDHLLACEATWHKGHSLAETVFSCLYMLKLDRTAPNALLHAFCKITRATCSLVRTAVALSDIHEEEDFVTFGFGLPLEGEGDSKCLATVNSVEELLARQLRGCRGLGKNKVSEAVADIEPLQDDPALEEELCEAILCRLRFRKALYHTLLYMDKPQGRGLETAQKHIAKALTELALMRGAHTVLPAQPVQNTLALEAVSTASGRPAVGFDENVNRRLLAPTPPRSIKILSWTETLDYYEKLLQDFNRICSVPFDLGLDELLQFIVDIQKSHPDLVARARLQLLLLQDNKLLGREAISDAVFKSIDFQDQSMAKDSETHNIIAQAGRLTSQLIRIMCTNSSWQRRKLGRVIQEWGILLEQAHFTRDTSAVRNHLVGLCEKPWWTDDVLLGWAAEQLCWIVAHFLMLGFELELYSLSEYCMVYRYLDHTLLHYKLAKKKSFLEPEQLKLNEVSDSAKKKRKKKKGSAPSKPITLKEIRHTAGMLHVQCHMDLCQGFNWMLAALTEDKKIVQRNTIFNTEFERFVQRFEVLHKIAVPEPLSYRDYRESTSDRTVSVEGLYQRAYDCFLDAQEHLQELTHAVAKAVKMSPVSRAQRALEVRQMEQVARRNREAIESAHRAGPGDNFAVSFEFSQHPCFAVAVLSNWKPVGEIRNRV